MRLAIQIITSLIALPMELAAIAGMLRGPYRQYPFVFIFVLADFLTGVVETAMAIPFGSDLLTDQGKIIFYWVDEAILQVLVYAAVISLLYYATKELPSRRIMRISLISFALVFAGVSFFLYYHPRPVKVGEWMTPWSSNLNFCAAILDLALWAILIASRKKDHRLLMLSGALGIQFTGQAIGQSLRNISRRSHSYWLLYSGNTVGILMNLAFLYILWQAFRKDVNPRYSK